MVRLQIEPFESGALLTRFCEGRVRGPGRGGELRWHRAGERRSGDEALELEAYPGFTESEIGKIAEAARTARFGLDDFLIVHRVGKIAPGEAIVFVATASGHRRAAFEAADHLMDYLKSRELRSGSGSMAPPERAGSSRPSATFGRRMSAGTKTRAKLDGSCAMTATLAPGGRIDESLAFTPVRVAVLTVSDTRDAASDTSGDLLAGRVAGAGDHELAGRAIVRDDRAAIRSQVNAWVASGEVDAIVSTGGTGLTGRDVTVEALEPLFDKEIDGFSGGVPHGELPVGGAFHTAVAGDRRTDRRRDRVLPAGLERGGEGRLGQGDRRPAR